MLWKGKVATSGIPPAKYTVPGGDAA